MVINIHLAILKQLLDVGLGLCGKKGVPGVFLLAEVDKAELGLNDELLTLDGGLFDLAVGNLAEFLHFLQ